MKENKNTMSEIKKFTNIDFGELRAFTDDNDQCWFVAIDVCNALDVKNNRDAISRLDTDERMTVGLTDTHTKTRGGAQSQTVINEAGLYTLVLSSRKPAAKAFKRWITHEVLPSLRTNSGYLIDLDITPESLENDPVIQKKLYRQLNLIERNNTTMQHRLDVVEPKAEFADIITTCDDTISVGQLAKLISDDGYKVGQNRLYSWLRKNKILMRGEYKNFPYQKYMDAGWFAVTEGYYGGELKYTLRVTTKGQKKIIQKYIHDQTEYVHIPTQPAPNINAETVIINFGDHCNRDEDGFIKLIRKPSR